MLRSPVSVKVPPSTGGNAGTGFRTP
jgi:hypothetical protein